MDTAEHELPREPTRIWNDDSGFDELDGEPTRPRGRPAPAASAGDKRPGSASPRLQAPAAARPVPPPRRLKPPPPPPPASAAPKAAAPSRPPMPPPPPSRRAPAAPGAAELAQALLGAHAQFAATSQARRADAASLGPALLAKVQRDFAPHTIPPPPPPLAYAVPYATVPSLPSFPAVTDAAEVLAEPRTASEREDLDALRPGVSGWVHKIVRLISRR